MTKSVHLNQSSREPHRTRGVQKLLSLDIFRYTYVFVTLNITGVIYELLLVFSKNRMSTACLLHEIQIIEISRLRTITDFRKICYRAVIEFFTLENVQLQLSIRNQMTVVHNDVLSRSSSGLPTFVVAEEALKLNPGRNVRPKQCAEKTVVLLKILHSKIFESMCS